MDKPDYSTNIVLLEKSTEIEQLSKELGFSHCLFLDQMCLIKETNKKVILEKINLAKKQKKLTICQTMNEDILRFVLERTAVDMVIGMEHIHSHDSVHYVRSGLDQVVCKIAAANNKIIAFSFQDLLHARNRSQLMARISFNLSLCKKYHVKTLFSNFLHRKEELRSRKDLEAFLRVLAKSRL
ncbi:hypothetical protein HYX12_04950 [Candidatus Woesearchaeota archaeon]|nr:hypothetical protein [Candidatus Woesearchaeota archaeon]